MAFNAGIVAGGNPPALQTLSDTIIGLSPVWYVKLDEATPLFIGKPCIDSSGNGLIATYDSASGSNVAGLVLGSSIAKKFTTGTVVLGPTITRADADESFSVSYFIKGPSTTSTRKIIGCNPSPGFQVETSNPGNAGAILLGSTGGNLRFTDSSNNIWDNATHHIAITVAQESGKLTVRMYTDGSQTFLDNASIANIPLTSCNLRLGTTSFDSTLDEVAFWQRKLSDSEILSIYNSRNL